MTCEFDPQLRRLFFQVYFCLAPLQKHVRKVVGGFGKKSCVSTGVRKPGNTYASLQLISYSNDTIKVNVLHPLPNDKS